MNLHAFGAFLRYYFAAQTIYDTDSAFLLQLHKEVLADDRHYYAFDEAELYRQQLRLRSDSIAVEDMGAGSKGMGRQQTRRIADIARYSLSPAWEGQLLFRLIHWLQPRTKIELGTSLGLTSLYQHLPNPQSSQFYTLEGCPNTAAIAAQRFAALPQPAPTLIVGNFDSTLPTLLQKIERLDYAFIDGNHREAPTLHYFELLMQRAHAQTVLVFDDIYWSKEMESAWTKIKADSRVFLSVDLFKLGIVFLNPTNAQSPQHWRLVPYYYKPWRLGLFRRGV